MSANAAATDLFTGWLDDTTAERNLLTFVFLSPVAPSLISDGADRARRLVAEFRADFNRHPNDPAINALLDRLVGESSLLASHWRNQDVLGREGGERCFTHPRRGELHFQQATLLAARVDETARLLPGLWILHGLTPARWK
ncbi:MAG: hypothetical protein ACR652_09655 [Methylocystis sp.]|uniref:MmyB family transcriptional regulator n=1 Tax=Methylocystis sp. TaxID=1911079 RepID=UPI003DA25ADB